MSAVWARPRDLSIADACAGLGLSRATLYRHRRSLIETPQVESAPVDSGPDVDPAAAETAATAAPESTIPPPPPRRRSPRALSDAERQAVLDALHEDRFMDRPPAQVYAKLLEEGQYHCSIRTMYRILEAKGEVRERRDQRRHPHYAEPQLCAVGPNRVWSWDITKLAGPEPRLFYSLYVVLNIFSRYVVGWLLADRECEALAHDLLAETCRKYAVQPGQLSVHADRGSPMKSKTVGDLLEDLGVVRSHSRPRVSNDNAYSESQFRTLKYRPDFPDRFDSEHAAHAHCRAFFDWYNNEHFHSALGLLTPRQVQYGLAADVLAQRQRVLDRAFEAHPERFVHGRPCPREPEPAVYINRPATTTPQAVPVVGVTALTPTEVSS